MTSVDGEQVQAVQQDSNIKERKNIGRVDYGQNASAAKRSPEGSTERRMDGANSQRSYNSILSQKAKNMFFKMGQTSKIQNKPKVPINNRDNNDTEINVKNQGTKIMEDLKQNMINKTQSNKNNLTKPLKKNFTGVGNSSNTNKVIKVVLKDSDQVLMKKKVTNDPAANTLNKKAFSTNRITGFKGNTMSKSPPKIVAVFNQKKPVKGLTFQKEISRENLDTVNDKGKMKKIENEIIEFKKKLTPKG